MAVMMMVMMLLAHTIRRIAGARAHGRAERLISRVLVCILLAVIHFLLECLGLFLIAERQPGKAIF
jgi:uncharacterized membrane protein